jgi:FMN-dependent NADH-azoreductase
MTRLLRIDSSSRLEGSHSRELADYFQNTWCKKYPDDQVIDRDIVKNPVPHIADLTIAGFYTPQAQQTEAMKQAIALSDELIEELQSADVLLLSVSMYNFSVPSSLKAWIDQIVRIGRTFDYDGTNFTELVSVKRAYVICAYGASGYTDIDRAISAI